MGVWDSSSWVGGVVSVRTETLGAILGRDTGYRHVVGHLTAKQRKRTKRWATSNTPRTTTDVRELSRVRGLKYNCPAEGLGGLEIIRESASHLAAVNVWLSRRRASQFLCESCLFKRSTPSFVLE